MAEDSCSGEQDTGASATDTRVNTCYQRPAQARARVIGEGDGAVRPAVGQ